MDISHDSMNQSHDSPNPFHDSMNPSHDSMNKPHDSTNPFHYSMNPFHDSTKPSHPIQSRFGFYFLPRSPECWYASKRSPFSLFLTTPMVSRLSLSWKKVSQEEFGSVSKIWIKLRCNPWLVYTHQCRSKRRLSTVKCQKRRRRGWKELKLPEQSDW